jgi:hypothetical protein
VSGFHVLARVRRMLLLLGVAFAALPVGSALADTTVGQTGGGFDCRLIVGSLLVDTNYVVPSGGLITSFSFQSGEGNAGQRIDFLVLRPGSGGSYSVVGKTFLVTLLGTGLETFAASSPIPVHSGDILGYWVNPGGVFTNCAHESFGNGGGFNFVFHPTDPNIGDTVTLDDLVPGIDLNESAHLRTVGSPPPTGKDQCKKGGWQTFSGMFKNQGDCVSFFASGGKNPPSGS